MTRRCHPADETPHEVVLDPAITKLLAAMSTPPTLQQLGPHDGRAALREAQRGSTAVRDTDAEFLTCPVGPCGLTGFWRIRPGGLSGRLPGVVYLHGGRWMFGDADTHAHIIDEVAQHCGACVDCPRIHAHPGGAISGGARGMLRGSDLGAPPRRRARDRPQKPCNSR